MADGHANGQVASSFVAPSTGHHSCARIHSFRVLLCRHETICALHPARSMSPSFPLYASQHNFDHLLSHSRSRPGGEPVQVSATRPPQQQPWTRVLLRNPRIHSTPQRRQHQRRIIHRLWKCRCRMGSHGDDEATTGCWGLMVCWTGGGLWKMMVCVMIYSYARFGLPVFSLLHG